MGAGASVRKDGSKGKADSSHEVASDTEDSSAVTTANEGDSAARGGAGEPARVRAFEHADNCTSAGQDPASCALLDNASPGKSPPESRSRKALPRCRSHVNGEFVSEEVDDASPRSAEDALPNKQQSMDLSRGVARSSSLDAGDLEAEDIEEGDLEAIDRESSAHSHQSGAAAPTKLVTTEDASASPLPSNAAAEVLRPKHHVNETPANRRSGGQLPPLARRPTSPHAFEGGILEVTILGASGVKQMDLTSKSDVYAVVTFGLEEVRTSVRKDVADCDWGEDGLGEWAWFFVPSTATERLEMRISLWDEDVPAHQVGASLYNRKKATSHGDDFIGSSVVQVESIRRKARLNRRMPSLGDAAAGLEQRKVEVKDKFGVVTGTVYYSVRMLNRREEVSGTFWRTLLRVVDCDGDASSVSQDDALALLEFLQAKKKVRAAVMQRMFGVSDPHEIVRHDVAGISESSDNSGRRGTKVNQVVHDASDLGLVEAVNSSPQSVSGDQQQGGGGQAVVETLSIPAAVEALVEVSSNYDLVSARFPADVVTGRSLAGLTPFEKECYLLQSLDHGNSNRMTSVASKDDRLHNSWMASLANDWNPPQNEQHSFVSSRQVRNRATGMMEDEYISSMVWLSLKAIYSKLFLEGISGLLDLMTAKMNKEARDPKQGKDLIAHFVKQYSIRMDEVRDPLSSFQTLNDFFVRRLKPEARPIASKENPRVLVSAADCRIMAFTSLSAATRAWIKGSRFSVQHMLGGDEDLAAKFVGGALTIFRLAPQDYHCFHFPCRGTLVSSTRIPGKLYSVNPIVVQHERVNVFTENVRVISVIDSPDFGTVVLVSVGATIVGSINLLVEPGAAVEKGDIFGNFQYGGSTVVMLTQAGRVDFDHDLVSCAETDNIETLVHVGEKIGTAPNATAAILP